MTKDEQYEDDQVGSDDQHDDDDFNEDHNGQDDSITMIIKLTKINYDDDLHDDSVHDDGDYEVGKSNFDVKDFRAKNVVWKRAKKVSQRLLLLFSNLTTL